MHGMQGFRCRLSECLGARDCGAQGCGFVTAGMLLAPGAERTFLRSKHI